MSNTVPICNIGGWGLYCDGNFYQWKNWDECFISYIASPIYEDIEAALDDFEEMIGHRGYKIKFEEVPTNGIE